MNRSPFFTVLDRCQIPRGALQTTVAVAVAELVSLEV